MSRARLACGGILRVAVLRTASRGANLRTVRRRGAGRGRGRTEVLGSSWNRL